MQLQYEKFSQAARKAQEDSDHAATESADKTLQLGQIIATASNLLTRYIYIYIT